MKSSVVPSFWVGVAALLLGVITGVGIIWVKTHNHQNASMPQSTPLVTPYMSGETRAENMPDATPSPTPEEVLREKG